MCTVFIWVTFSVFNAFFHDVLNKSNPTFFRHYPFPFPREIRIPQVGKRRFTRIGVLDQALSKAVIECHTLGCIKDLLLDTANENSRSRTAERWPSDGRVGDNKSNATEPGWNSIFSVPIPIWKDPPCRSRNNHLSGEVSFPGALRYRAIRSVDLISRIFRPLRGKTVPWRERHI